MEPWPFFTAPTGLRVVLSYPSRGTESVSAATGSKVTWRCAIPQNGEKNSPLLVGRSMAANYFHSLDASCVTASALSLRDKGRNSVAYVHDCVAAPAPV